MDFSDIQSTVMNSLGSVQLTFAVITVILHVIFASAIAKDAGRIVKMGRTTYFVSGITWAFATLVGGVWVAGLYWFIHYSNFKSNP